MESQENTYALKLQPPLSITGVLREAFKITHRNGKLVLSILVLVFLSSSQLELGSRLVLTPTLKNFYYHRQTSSSYEYQEPRSSSYSLSYQWPYTNKYAYSSTHNGKVNQNSLGCISKPLTNGQMKDLHDYYWVEMLLIQVNSCAISLFLMVSAISSSYKAHTTKVVSLKDVFLKFRESWKRSVYTSFCLGSIYMGLFSLFVTFNGMIAIISEGISVYLLYGIAIIIGFLTYFHMAVVWMLGIVVSVLESEYSGFKAIDKSVRLMKEKRIQALGLMLLFHLALGAIHIVSGAMTKKLQGYKNMDFTTPFTIGLTCVLELFMFVVFTVYYHERKMNRQEVIEQLGPYVPIADD